MRSRIERARRGSTPRRQSWRGGNGDEYDDYDVFGRKKPKKASRKGGGFYPLEPIPEDFDASYWGDWNPDEGPDDWAPSSNEEEKDYLRYPRGRDPRPRYPGSDTPRDPWLKPIADLRGVYDRLNPDQQSVEEALLEEAETNMYETRQALKFFAIWLVALPLLTGWSVSRLIAEPLLQYDMKTNEDAFALTRRQKLQGAEAVHRAELHARMMSAIGAAPPLTEEDMMHELRHAAKEFEEEAKEENERALINLISDSLSLATFVVTLARRSFGRRVLIRTIKRFVGGLSDVSKAFVIILTADTLLGYHSEEGWTATVTLITEHYGMEVETEQLSLFVCFVPVLLDSLFKYWIFTGLNRNSPQATVTLRQMDRH